MANPLSFGGPAGGMFGRLTRPLYSMPMMTEAEKDTARRNYSLQQKRNPTLAQRAGRATENAMLAIGAPKLVAQSQGQSIEQGIGFLPIIGDVTGAQESGRMIGEGLREGNRFKTAFGAGTGILGMLPFVPSLAGALGGKADEIVKGAENIASSVTAPAQQGIRAYHGSPHSFDKFDMSKLGTGEGAQAYGHGLYFAEAEPVAETYTKPVAKWMYGGKDPEDIYMKVYDKIQTPKATPLDYAAASFWEQVALGRPIGFVKSDALANAEDWPELAEYAKTIKDKDISRIGGNMYEVQIDADPNKFVNWDSPVSNQNEQIRRAALEADISHLGEGHRSRVKMERFRQGQEQLHDPLTGREMLMAIDRGERNDFTPQTTEFLKKYDIPGIKFLDEQSRLKGEGTSNFVVFDDKLVSILKRYGWVPGTAVPAWMMSQAQSERDKGI